MRGRALLLLCEYEASGAPFTGRTVDLFDVLLLPGAFTPFSRFAELVCEQACLRDRPRPILHGRDDKPPASLRSRCESDRCTELGFWPSQVAVERGLRESLPRLARNA